MSMRVPSVLHPSGLVLSVSKPLVLGGGHLYDLCDEVGGWRSTTHAVGGFWEAGCPVFGPAAVLEEWVESGLDRHLELHGPGGEVLWEGFVNQLTYTTGKETITVGPLMAVANEVDLWFSEIDTSVTPPILGDRAAAGWASDLTSQELYGIWRKILSGPGISRADVEQVRDLFLQERAYPKSTEQVGETSSTPRLNLVLAGYAQRMQVYPYDSATTGDQDLTTKLLALLAAEPNGLFPTTTPYLTANTTQVKAYENDHRKAWDIVKELVLKGDGALNRYLFGIYAGRLAHYEVAPARGVIGYEYNRATDTYRIPGGPPVQPWELLPGRWLLKPDLLPGRKFSGPDPRQRFLETVTFAAPRTATWTSGDADRLPQKLARLGISGIGE